MRGLNGSRVQLSAEDLASLPQKTISTSDHGKAATFEGVLLTDVLSKVDRPVGEQFHSTVASFYLVVQAKDGYRAVYAWAELDASFLDRAIYVVTKRNGEPLAEKAGPLQLVAPGEKRGARWMRQVVALEIRQAN